MAEQVAIPAGINPGAAIPAGATVHQSSRGAAQPSSGAPAAKADIPAVPSSAEQKPGFVPAPAAPAPAGDPEYAAFLAWKASQEKPADQSPDAQAKPPVAAPAPTPSAFEGFGAQGALEAVKAAGDTDAVISSSFEVMTMVAPDVDLVRALGNAIDRADVSLIDKAYLREVGGDKADRLIKIAEAMVTHVNTKVESIVADIHSTAGSEANWNAATAAFNQAAPEYLKGYVVDALNSTNPNKIKQGVAAVLDFVKKNGTVPTPPQGHVRAGGGQPDASLGLSKEAYQAARLKLNRNDRGYADQARELDARRALGKKMGM